MRRRWHQTFGAALTVAVALSTASGCSGDDDKKKAAASTTVAPEPPSATIPSVDILNIDPQFQPFADLLKLSGVDVAVRNAEATTVLAPSNEAFAKLPAADIEAIKAEPNGALADLLKSHVLTKRYSYSELANMNGEKVETLAGTSLTVTVINGQVFMGTAAITKTDIEADGGIIQVLSDVILDPDAVIDPATVPTSTTVVDPAPTATTTTTEPEPEN